MTPIPLRLNRWSGCRCCLQHEQVGGFGGEGCGGEEGGGGCGDCDGRANSGAGGGGPWSVSTSSSSSLPRTCAADSFISAQLNWPAAVVRACPAAPLRAPSRLSLRPIVASVTCGSSKRDGLAAGCSLAGRYVVSYSVAGCSVAGCSVVMRPKCGGWVQGRCESGWAASRTCTVSQLEMRFRGLCGRSSCSDGRIFGTLAGLRPDGCVMAARLHVCPLGTLELEGVTTAA